MGHQESVIGSCLSLFTVSLLSLYTIMMIFAIQPIHKNNTLEAEKERGASVGIREGSTENPTEGAEKAQNSIGQKAVPRGIQRSRRKTPTEGPQREHRLQRQREEQKVKPDMNNINGGHGEGTGQQRTGRLAERR